MSVRRRLPSPISLALVLAACGDSGGDTAGASTTVTTAPATAGTAQTSGEPTSGAGTTAAETADAASTTGATAADTTAAGSATTDAATTGDASTTGATVSTSSGGTTEQASGTTGQASGTTGGPVCGDGVVSPGETCDDGSGVGCDTDHDGGDGTCVPAGMCSPGYVLAGPDCVAELWVDHVHIMVDNTCKMQVTPSSFTVQPGQKLRLDYHNHSVDYPVDVWMHYNGGYTDLQPGATWMEKYEHCFGPAPSEGWAKISTACSEYVLPIHCL